MGHESVRAPLKSTHGQGLNAALDEAEGDERVTCMILAAEGKFWCNGLDLKYLDFGAKGSRARKTFAERRQTIF